MGEEIRVLVATDILSEGLNLQDCAIIVNYDLPWAIIRLIPPFGLAGGKAGKIGRNAVERNDGTIEELPGTATVEMNLGDIFIIETPGGGGYGNC